MTRLKKQRFIILIALFALALLDCSSSKDMTTTRHQFSEVEIETNLSRYSPGQAVVFSVQGAHIKKGEPFVINYYFEGNLIKTDSLNAQDQSMQWNWMPPETDYRGYLVEVSGSHLTGTIGVDVSSNWSRYPRYGFVSKYEKLSDTRIDSVIQRLNRFHINGIQFYDWHNSHHKPLPTANNIAPETWVDIANRTIYKSTVEKYIEAAHGRNMEAMAYNLLYGAWGSGFSEDLSKEWILYKKKDHLDPFFLDLPEGWADDIYMMNTSNAEWNNYVIESMAKTLEHLKFDGWHVDQIGDLGELYSYDSKRVVLKSTFTPFLAEAKERLNTKLVMNAVAQYGGEEISKSPIDFLYNEVWNPDSTFNDLAQIISEARSYQGQNIVIPAYMNYKNSVEKGNFNTPGVLLTDAVIMAQGGIHLELGEHMLCHEYFPNDNLAILPELDDALMAYYDFAVAYETLLRGPQLTKRMFEIESSTIPILPEASAGSIWSFANSAEDKTIIHFINLRDVENTNWRDEYGTRKSPEILINSPVSLEYDQDITRVLAVSPDINGGIPQTLKYTYNNNVLSFNIPSLHYWTSIIVES